MKIEHRNILDLENPSEYQCEVLRLQQFNKLLVLKIIRNPTSNFYIMIAPTLYFSGPMEWVGADFGLASVHDCLTFYADVFGKDEGYFDKSPLLNDSVLTMSYRLYVIPTNGMEIRILAGRYLEKYDTNPLEED